MDRLKQLQQAFIENLRHDNPDIAGHIADAPPLDTSLRLGIYRNAYRARLRQAIDTDHPMLGIYLGDDLFEQMIAGYIRTCPSSATSLRDFGERLPAYLAQTAPFSDHPIVSELARFERHLLYAFDAATAPRLKVADIQAVSADDWPAMRLRFHPSVQPFLADWNSVESWRALKQQQTPPPATRMAGVWLLWRSPQRLTEFRSLNHDEAAMLKGFLHGEDVAAVCERLLEWHAPERIGGVVSSCLQDWLQQGLIRDYR